MRLLNPQVRMAKRSHGGGGGAAALAIGPRAGLRRVWRRLAPDHLRDALWRYQLAHRRQVFEGLDKLAQQPISSLFIVLVLGVTLALPAGAVMVFDKVWRMAQLFQPDPQAHVYFHSDTPLDKVTVLAHAWQSWPEVAGVRVIDRDEGLHTYMTVSGIDPSLVMGLDENPLPHVARIALRGWSPEAAQVLEERLKAVDEVEWVQLDLVWLQRFRALLDLAERFLWLFAWSLGAVVVLIVANTVRLAIEHRRQDIVVSKLVGATNAFVRRPFLYLGFVLGLLGGLCALLLLKFASVYLSAPFESLLRAYAVEGGVFQWRAELVLGVLLSSALLGWVGAWFAARKHLASIEPT
ncbi:MAG: permease-like cell division protein FtsX [Gammaproteobacteria bacterium]